MAVFIMNLGLVAAFRHNRPLPFEVVKGSQERASHARKPGGQHDSLVGTVFFAIAEKKGFLS